MPRAFTANATWSSGAMMLTFGLLPFSQMIGKPRFETLHGSDVVQLTGSGACFGFGAAALCGLFKFRPE
jgi:hypothetical protein